MRRESRYVLGVDLGQAQDYSALVLVERTRRVVTPAPLSGSGSERTLTVRGHL